MPGTYFPLVLPVGLVTDIDRRAKAHGQSRNAFLINIIKSNLDSGQALRFSLGTMQTGPSARRSQSKTVSLLVSTELKGQLLTMARQMSTTQATICRAIIAGAFSELDAQADGKKPPSAVTVIIPPVDTSVPESMDHALQSIGRQLCQYGRPTQNIFSNTEERDLHLRKLELFSKILAALYGHSVELTEPDIELMLKEWGVQQAILIASILNVSEIATVLAKIIDSSASPLPPSPSIPG